MHQNKTNAYMSQQDRIRTTSTWKSRIPKVEALDCFCMLGTVGSWLFEQKVDACSACWVRMYHVLATLKWASSVFCQSCSSAHARTWNLEVGDYTACATWQLGCLAYLHCLYIMWFGNLETWVPCLPTLPVYTAYLATWVPCLPTLPIGRPQVRRLRGGREEVAFLTPRISPVRAN